MIRDQIIECYGMVQAIVELIDLNNNSPIMKIYNGFKTFWGGDNITDNDAWIALNNIVEGLNKYKEEYNRAMDKENKQSISNVNLKLNKGQQTANKIRIIPNGNCSDG